MNARPEVREAAIMTIAASHPPEWRRRLATALGVHPESPADTIADALLGRTHPALPPDVQAVVERIGKLMPPVTLGIEGWDIRGVTIGEVRTLLAHLTREAP